MDKIAICIGLSKAKRIASLSLNVQTQTLNKIIRRAAKIVIYYIFLRTIHGYRFLLIVTPTDS